MKNIYLYDVFFNQENGLPELRKIKKINYSREIEYTTNDIVEMLNKCFSFSEMRSEHSYVVALTDFRHVNGIGILGIGRTDEVCMDLKVLGAYLLLMGADKFIILHNHPNGTCEPSIDDEQITIKIKNLATIFDIEMEDHVIVANDGWYGIISKQCNYN